MHDTTAIIASRTAPQTKPVAPYSRGPRYAQFHRHYPTVDYLRQRARRHIPHFAFEYADGGSGKDDAGIRRNWAALDAIELVPRYGVMPKLPTCEVELFGRRYNAPIGIAPMGGPSIIWPGGDLHLGPRGATRRHSLCAVHGRRCDHRRGGARRARCFLVSALPVARQRPRCQPRSRQPRGSGRLPHACAHARCAGAHHAPARSGDRHRRRVQYHSSHSLADHAGAGLGGGDPQTRHAAFRQPANLCRRRSLAQRCDRLRAARDSRCLHLG